MRQLSYIFILFLFFIGSCTQEKAITKTPENDFFKKNETTNSSYISGVPVSANNQSVVVQGRVNSQTCF
jgi:hypothetical protein